jgi:hypothetical protein
MQTLTTCMQCQVETGLPNLSSMALADIPEDGVIEVTCDRGHRTATIIQEAKFEILSEMGVWAIANGSYRDSVFSLAGALERLYEFFIEAACRKQGISTEAFTSSWKSLASQSERQLGAFVVAYLMDVHEPPKLLPKSQVEFRNAVVHKGRLATRDEAMRFGRAVFDCALPLLALLKSATYADIIRTMTFEHIRDRSHRARDAGLLTCTMSMATALSLAAADQPGDFETLVADFAKRPDLKGVVESSHNLAAKIAPVT